MRKNGLRKLEATSLAIGLILLALFLAFRIHSAGASRIALWQAARMFEGNAASATPKPREPDRSLWSKQRIDAYMRSLRFPIGGPIAVLTIPRISLEVPVFDGTDELILNRGAGRIEGTARPGEEGNIGIAGHRDGFFRSLKEIRSGDRIELATQNGRMTYIVSKTEIVSPDDVGVLQPTVRPVLTLVTCYPFYFIGNAPKRFIVHASIAERRTPGRPQSKVEISTIPKQEVTK